MFKTVLALTIFHILRVAADDSNEFFEVNAKLVSKDSVKFGAKIFTDTYERHADQIKQIGPVFQLAYWQVVQEVSGAAPAPHNANDDMMNRWIDSVYFYLKWEMDTIENTSNLLVNEGIHLVAAAISPPNSYYAYPKAIEKLKEEQQARESGITVEPPGEDEWMKMAEEKAKEDPATHYNMFISDSVRDYAKFWAASMEFLHNNKLSLPYLELTWEPDDKGLVYLLPDDYAASVKATREELRKKGIADDLNKIVGPGTSNALAAKEYIEAIVKDRESYDAIHSWSIHLHDRGGSMQQIEKELLGFKQILKATIPSSWPKKPVIVTSFGYNPESNLMSGDIEFNGNLDMCYKEIMGMFQERKDDLPNTMSQSPKTGVRLLASLMLQYSLGFSNSIYEEFYDTKWSFACRGLYDRENRRKQILVALTSFLQHLPKDAKVIKKQWKNANDCISTMVKSKSRIVIAVANPTNSACVRSFSLSGLPTKKLGEGFTVSYNNGTVSLGASDPADALLLKLPLDYDVYEDEEGTKGSLVEFDISVGPHASATAVIELNKAKKINSETSGDSIASAETSASHTEL